VYTVQYNSVQCREVRCVFSRRLKVSNMLDSLIAAGSLFLTVGAEN